MMKRRTLLQYVDNAYVGFVYTAWPLIRAVRELRKKYPNANEWEVSEELAPVSSKLSTREIPPVPFERMEARTEKCLSGWTGDRCQFPLHHEGPCSN